MDGSCLPQLAVEFPKTVRIANRRLGLMYFLLVAAALCVVVTNVVLERLYLQLFTPSGRVFFWVDPTTWNTLNDEQINEVNRAYGELDVCEGPERFEYCDTEKCAGSHWKDLSCQDICTNSNVGDCAEKTERWFKEDQGIFFPTYFNDTVLTDPGGARVVQTSQKILKGTEEMVLSFDHEYLVMSGDYQLARGNSKDEEGGLLTVLLAQNSNTEVQRWLPGDTVNIPLGLILEVGGLSLDEVKKDYGENYVEGAEFPAGVLARLAGAEIDVVLSYANRYMSHTYDWYGPVCYIRINTAVAWTSKPMLDLLDTSGSQRLRYYQGVRIKFKTGGSWGRVSFGQILSALTSCLVFMGAAKKLTIAFATTCLGALSRIYKRFIRQEASVQTDACGLAARLTAHASGFMELKDMKSGISRGRFEKRFERIFKNETRLNRAEITRFSDYVYDRMTEDPDTAMTVQEYARACAYGEQMTVQSLIEIFDADRKKPFLEKVFVDDSLRAILKSDKELRGEKGLQQSAELLEKQKEEKKSKPNAEHITLSINPLDVEGTAGESLDKSTAPKAMVVRESDPPNASGARDTEASANGAPKVQELTSSKLAAEDEDGVDEDDILEIVQASEIAMKEHAMRLEESHRHLQAMVKSHTSQIEELGRSIGSIQSSKMSARKVEPSIEIVQALQDRVTEHTTALGDLHTHVQASGNLQDSMSTLESLKENQSLCKLDIERLTKESHQLQAEVDKLSRRNNTMGQSGGMVIEETTRKVIQGSSQQDGMSSHQGAQQGASARRKERPCGIPADWDLCGDRPLDAHEVKNIDSSVKAEDVKINGHVIRK